MRHLTTILLYCLAISLAPTSQADTAVDTIKDVAAAVFSETEKRIIRDYYQRRQQNISKQNKKPKHHKKGKKGLPPGLAKKDALPPGLQKQLQRNGKLPPGLEKRALPTELRDSLPRRADRYERVIADGKVLLVERASGIIADIISDAILKD